MRVGQPLLEPGVVLNPSRIGVAAATGVHDLPVYARPVVGIVSTGNELTTPGQPLPAGHVYEINRYTVDAVMKRHGAASQLRPSAGDTIEEIAAALDAFRDADVIIVSGGSSVGERDLLLDAVRARGDVIFHGVAVKPGKPLLFARVGRSTVFGLPGNPASCLSNAYMFVVPFVRRLARLPDWEPRRVSLPLARRIISTAGRHQFYTVRIANGAAEPAFKASGDITSMAHADGYFEIPVGVDAVEAETIVRITLF
jgi:molybdenum cofactor synthesis domain-containing protein